MAACESLYAPIVGGAGALPLPAVSSRIKAGVADGSFSQSQLPAVRAVTGVFQVTENGVMIRPVLSLLRSLSRNTYCHNKKTGGQSPERSRLWAEKRNFPFTCHRKRKRSWSVGIRRTAAKVSLLLSRKLWTSIWTTSAPTTPVCSSPPPSNPTWTDGWDSWRNGCPQSLSGRRWNRTWWLVSWPMPISSATRICAVGGRRVYKM